MIAMDMKSRIISVSKPSETERALRYRFACGFFAAVCLVPLVVAAFLNPASEGLGTHKQLGKPACGFYVRTGYPCPTCGMTTAFAHTVRGELYQAFAVQPAGALAALLCAVGAVGGIYITSTGRRIDHYLVRINWILCFFLTAVVVLASWGWICLLTYIRSR
jgi:uncharacterized protein DUF2752